jgi:hypothetical protein
VIVKGGGLKVVICENFKVVELYSFKTCGLSHDSRQYEVKGR